MNPKILIVEDLATDAELARREIDRELGPCSYRVVETKEDFIEALAGFDPELIISDYYASTVRRNGRVTHREE